MNNLKQAALFVVVLFLLLSSPGALAFKRSSWGLTKRAQSLSLDAGSRTKSVAEFEKGRLTNPCTAAAAALLTAAPLTALAKAAGAAEQVLTRNDVGFINLNETMPEVTDVCWLDISIGDTSSPSRVEISLFGGVTPKAAENFKALAMGKPGYGYKGSDIFRVVATFSVQGGNINSGAEVAQSQLGKEGKSAFGEGFAPENFRILHSYKDAGVVSLMKDLKNKNMQDSRFFITTSPYASWADERYCAFGYVSKGMDLVRGLSILPTTPPSNYPNTRIRIVDSGVY